MILRHALSIVLLGIFLLTGCTLTPPAPTSTTSSAAAHTPVFAFAAVEHDFGVLKQSGGVVSYSFPFTYTGTQPVMITGTPGSCACTTAATDKKAYRPGERGALTVWFNPNLHAEPEGRFFKTVNILTSPASLPTPEVKIWAQIDLDLGPAGYELQPAQAVHDDDHAE